MDKGDPPQNDRRRHVRLRPHGAAAHGSVGDGGWRDARNDPLTVVLVQGQERRSLPPGALVDISLGGARLEGLCAPLGSRLFVEVGGVSLTALVVRVRHAGRDKNVPLGPACSVAFVDVAPPAAQRLRHLLDAEGHVSAASAAQR